MKHLKFIVFAVSLIPAAVSGNQVWLQDIKLAELVSRSELILVVKPLSPFVTAQKIAVEGYNLRDKTAHIPDFETGFFNVELVRVLKNRSNADLSERKLRVYPAFTSDTFYLHIKYYAEAVSKSPIYEIYKTSVTNEADLIKEASFIVFVSKSGGKKPGMFAYQLACVSGYDRLSVLPDVERLLAEGKSGN